MPEIDELTLAIAITALDQQMAELEKQIDSLPRDSAFGAKLDDLHLRLEKAAWVLQDAYEAASASDSNLRPYKELVRPDNAARAEPKSPKLKLI